MKPAIDHDPIRASDAVIQRLRANHPSLIDLTTGRVERLLAALGHPERRLPPVIHVAGTNGKGSTVAYLRAIAEAAGLKVHAITSPHLVRFAERIRIAGELISDEKLNELTDRLEAANAGEPISFFEITTVLAIQAFADTPADLCIVEVGLGGRFDATNIFDAPALSVITPIDYDHLEMLGPELSKIAWEKAGIIKTCRPVVSARQPEEAGNGRGARGRRPHGAAVPDGARLRRLGGTRSADGADARPPAGPAAAQPVRRLPVPERRPGGRRSADLRSHPQRRGAGQGCLPRPFGRPASSA